MSQHDFDIANQTFPLFRADNNSALQALASNNSGATEPSTTFAYQFWYDTTTDLLKMRDEANTGWISLAYFNTTDGRWELRSDVIQAVSAAGVTIKDSGGTALLTVADSGQITVTGTIAGLAAASSKTTPVDADTVTILDSAASNILKLVTWVNIKATLKTYFDTLYNLTISATTSAEGTVELATSAEGDTGTDPARVPPVDIVVEMIGTHAPASGLQLLATQDLSSDATADFTEFNAATYDSYVFVLMNVLPATADVQLRFRTSSDGGSTYDSGASDYAYATLQPTGAGGSNDAEDDTSTYMVLAGHTSVNEGVGSGTSEDGVSMSLTLYGPHIAKETHASYIGGFVSDTPTYTHVSGGGVRRSQADIDAVRFYFESGNIESGTINMYGMRNS